MFKTLRSSTPKFALFFLLFTTGLLLRTPVFAQTVSGHFFIGGLQEESSSSIIELSDGDYFFCGNTKSYGNGGHDLLMIRFNPDFSIEWQKTVGGVSDDYFNNMTLPIENNDSSLTILAMTNSFGMGQADILVQKISSNGNIIWSKIYGGNQSERSDVIKPTLDGGYIFGGHTDSYNTLSSTVTERDLFLVKIDSSGNVLWSKTMGTTDNNDLNSSNSSTQITDITILQDSSFIIAGVMEGLSSLDASNFIARINSDGSINWFKKYTESTADGYEVINSISLQENNNAIACGLTTYGTIGGTGKGLVFSFNIDNGTINWSNIYGHTSSSTNWVFNSLKESTNKYVMSLYQDGSGFGNFDVSSFAIDSNGTILQQKVFGTSNFDRSTNFTHTSDGGYIFSGISGTGANSDSYLIKVDSSWNTPCNNSNIVINMESITITPQSYNPTIVSSINSSSISLTSINENVNIDTLCSFISSITDYSNKMELEIYPNPTSNILFIKIPTNNKFDRLEIIDINGKISTNYNSILKNGTLEINVEDLPNGTYFIQMFKNSQPIYSNKFSVIK